jgi:hypothetical protein
LTFDFLELIPLDNGAAVFAAAADVVAALGVVAVGDVTVAGGTDLPLNDDKGAFAPNAPLPPSDDNGAGPPNGARPKLGNPLSDDSDDDAVKAVTTIGVIYVSDPLWQSTETDDDR